MKKIGIILLIIIVGNFSLHAQRVMDRNGNDMAGTQKRGGFRHDDRDGHSKNEKPTPIGIRTWTVNRFNDIDSVAIDTFSHQFMNESFTEGKTFRYGTLGNLGSPRISRILTDRPSFNYFIFSQPYNYFLTDFTDFHFTNTLCPVTNVTYHETTSSDQGEDHIHAKYAVNIDKTAGIGFHLNYLYGRGYYQAQNTSQFNATLYGSVIKDKYQAHVRFSANYLKTAENGGIESDDYVSHPENFPSKFETNDIPTRLYRVWNKMYVNTLQLTHSYNVGFYKYIDERGLPLADSIKDRILRGEKDAKDSTQVAPIGPKHPVANITNDSIQQTPQNITSIAQKGNTADNQDSIPKYEKIFIPVTSFIHSMDVSSNIRRFIANQKCNTFFTDDYFVGDSALDKISHVQVSNMFAVELKEGFNKWAVSGIRLFAKHDFNHYSLPSSRVTFTSFNENRLTLGTMLLRRQGKFFNYNLTGQTSSDGSNWGEFELKGQTRLNMPLFGDTVSMVLNGSIVNERPTFFYRHYQGKYLWWDNDNLDNQFTTKLGITIANHNTKTKLSLNIENIKKYTYFASTYTQLINGTNTYNTLSTTVEQCNKNIQYIGATLNQDFKLGILNWENELTYQKSTNQEALPLPQFMAYSNLYLLFRIAKVLRVEFGGDVHYFSEYYAPTYNPSLGMYTTQPEFGKIKIGNYPVIDIYANCHLKHTRFYIMYSHVNYSNEGSKSFQTAHYPINPGMLKLGLSWNFFN